MNTRKTRYILQLLINNRLEKNNLFDIFLSKKIYNRKRANGKPFDATDVR